MKPNMTSLLYVCTNADTRTAVRLAVDLETGEYATYLNRNQGEPEHDERGHYFKCEGATHLAHKFALDDFFQRLDKGT